MYMKAITAAILLSCGVCTAAIAADAGIQATLDNPDRPPEDRARDALRKPAELIAFAGLKPGDKVIDYMPGGGYFTRIFSKLVGPNGKVYAFAPFIGPTPWSDAAKKAADAAGRPVFNPVTPAIGIQDITAFNNVTAILTAAMSYGGTVSVPEQVDMVWTSDNYHDFHNKMPDAFDMAAINKAIFRALKPGGVYIVIDHAARKGAGFSQTDTLHRADPDAVKKEILAAGFVFEAESKILANPADDHTKGVRDMHDQTDQFVFKFRKPANASPETKRHPDSDLANYYGNTFMLGTFLRIMYHPDHSYQEFSNNNNKVVLTSGQWYADADGHICLLHQSPGNTRGFVACHPFEEKPVKQAGDSWTETASDGTPWPVSIQKGIVYP